MDGQNQDQAKQELIGFFKKRNLISDCEGKTLQRLDDEKFFAEISKTTFANAKSTGRQLMLYQILLDEYETIELLDQIETSEIHGTAARKLAELVCNNKWDGARNAKNRKTYRNEILAEIRNRIHAKEDQSPPAALCFSGGGIRSATFGLGILQSLAKHGLLDRFHYLSTVSGGGYIGSWLSSWIFRERANGKNNARRRSDCENEKRKIQLPPKDYDDKSVSEIQTRLNSHSAGLPEPREVSHLRSFSNYMSPRTGLFSTDTWTLFAVYLTNLLLNWMVFIPLMAAILLLPKLLVSIFIKIAPLSDLWMYVLLGTSVAAGLIGIGLINMLRPSLRKYSCFPQLYRTDEIGKTTSGLEPLYFCVFSVLILAVGMTMYWFRRPPSDNSVGFSSFVVFGIVLILGGYLASWGVMFWKWKAPKPEPNSNKFLAFFNTYLSEPIYSLMCGAIGGALLYVVVEGLIPKCFPDQLVMNKSKFYVCFGVPIFLTVFLLSATIFTGLTVRITIDDDREWMARFGAVLLKIIVAWCVISSAVIFGPKLIDDYIFRPESEYSNSIILQGAGGFLAAIAGLFSVMSGFSSKTPAVKGEPAKDWTSYLIQIASSVLAPIFVLFLFVLISFGTQALTKNIPFPDGMVVGFNQTKWFIIFAVIGCGMGLFVNINKFSFHSTYRERLIRAYLGASNPNRTRQANSFTGLNTELDNVEMRDLKQKPFHILNMTLNLVTSDNLAWQNRKAESFTVSPLHSGSSNMGEGSGNYRTSECYGYNSQNKRAITLGTSLAISGASASPNMGYYTQSAAVSFLMVLFNVRLGWWLGNPGSRGNPKPGSRATPSWKRAAPRWSPKTFFAEALGLTNDSHSYVYLADGGQFENLGLYEMVLRRCKTIVVCDGGSDPEFGFFDLGSAIHKIRVDMGISIEFDSNPIKGRNCSIATIRYSDVDKNRTKDDGTLIYIKPTLDKNQPIDIVQYQKTSPAFPQEGTIDQFYSETQFESYRKLGFNMLESILDGHNVNSIAGLKAAAESYLAQRNDEPFIC